VLSVPGLPDVVLDPPTMGDADDVTRLCQDPEIQAWTVIPVPYTRSDALAFLDDVARRWADGSVWTWAIREAGRLVGMIGLERQPSGSAEIGYWIASEVRGRGLMTAAVGTVVAHAFDEHGLGLNRLFWQAKVGNWASRRVAERAGFTIEGTIRGHGVARGIRYDTWVATLLREDWVVEAGTGSVGHAASHLVLWQGLDVWRSEAAEVRLSDGHLVASGTQLGIDPLPYRLDYRLWTGPDFLTRRLDVVAVGRGWRRHLDLRRADDGTWSCTAESDGQVDQPDAGGDGKAFAGALDCDLACSPLTNTMPVLRHGLLARRQPVDLLMAWVSVPDLGVHASRQRYEHVRAEADGSARVRYLSEDRSFVREITFGPDRLVSLYPGLAERVDAARWHAGQQEPGETRREGDAVGREDE
jgi:RimJ/RimL family protein N-acetyltransferase